MAPIYVCTYEVEVSVGGIPRHVREEVNRAYGYADGHVNHRVDGVMRPIRDPEPAGLAEAHVALARSERVVLSVNVTRDGRRFYTIVGPSNQD